MQYQVYNEETGEVIAWLDTKTEEHIVLKGFNIKAGDNLSAVEVSSAKPKGVAKFEKVSRKQWLEDRGTMIKEFAEVCYKNLECPVRKTTGSAGYDFLAPYTIIIPPHQTVEIITGIKCQIDDGYVLELYPRSSLGFNYKLTLDNTVGVIDSDYYNNEKNEGHIHCKMTNNSDKELVIHSGEGYMQGVFKKYYLTKDDEVTAKRTGGIGSTNSK